MVIKISKRDVVWNYVAQFFGIGAGFITLPLILNKLSADEIGMNYLMLSVSSLVALADFGFSDQFGRNITYVFSGAKRLEKEGMAINGNNTNDIDYHLLSVVIATTKYIFRRISVLVFILMIIFGSLYMYHATDGFISVKNSLYIWILFCVSTFFEMYFKYYSSLLVGAAMIMESKKAIIFNKSTYLLLCITLLFLGFGLFSIVIANLIAPFVGRWYSYICFFSKQIKDEIGKYTPSTEEIKETFVILWYNAKKLGINFIGAYGIQQSSTFIIGLYLPLAEVASYGLMCQLGNVLMAISNGVFITFLPVFSRQRVQGDKQGMIKDYSFTQTIYFILFIVGFVIIVLWGPSIIQYVSTSTQLPSTIVIVIYLFNLMLECFHSMAGCMIVTSNEVPFVKAGLITGASIVFLNLLSLQFTKFGLLGIVLGQLFASSAYNHWRWPKWVLDDLGISYKKIVYVGTDEIYKHLLDLVNTTKRHE